MKILFNGHGIYPSYYYGSGTGIGVYSRDSVSLVGPGRVEGFFTAVELYDSRKSKVKGLTLYGSYGLGLFRTHATKVSGNEIYGDYDPLTLYDSRYDTLSGNLITFGGPYAASEASAESGDGARSAESPSAPSEQESK